MKQCIGFVLINLFLNTYNLGKVVRQLKDPGSNNTIGLLCRSLSIEME